LHIPTDGWGIRNLYTNFSDIFRDKSTNRVPLPPHRPHDLGINFLTYVQGNMVLPNIKKIYPMSPKEEAALSDFLQIVGAMTSLFVTLRIYVKSQTANHVLDGLDDISICFTDPLLIGRRATCALCFEIVNLFFVLIFFFILFLTSDEKGGGGGDGRPSSDSSKGPCAEIRKPPKEERIIRKQQPEWGSRSPSRTGRWWRSRVSNCDMARME
jgi:hypothetical protein